MITDGKLRKYLLYAVGEILLVMVGILLAFQVDKWNEQRLNKIKAVGYYINLRGDLERQRDNIRGQDEYNGQRLDMFNYALEISKSGNREHLDTIVSTIPHLFDYSDYDQNGNIYEILINSGDIKYLKNADIINRVRGLEWRYQYINRMENIHWDVILEHVAPWASLNVKFAGPEAVEPQNLYSFEFQNLLILLQRIMSEKQVLYKATVMEIDQLIEELNTEIDAGG